MDPEELARLGFQEDPPGFEPDVTPAPAAEPDEPDLSEIGGAGWKGMGNAGDPMRIDGAGATRPAGTVETGRMQRTLVLPESTGLPGSDQTRGESTIVEDREVRPQNWLERGAQWAHDAVGDASLPAIFGFDEPTAQSAANAYGDVTAGDQRQRMSNEERGNAFIPTAADPDGVTSSQWGDRRSGAGMMGWGHSIPGIGEGMDLLEAIPATIQQRMNPPRRIHGGPNGEQQDMGPAPLNARDVELSDLGYQRQHAHDRAAAVQQQAPTAYGIGSAGPNVALGLAGAPSGGSALGRIGRAGLAYGGLGASQGALESTSWGDVPGNALAQGALSGATGAIGQGIGEGLAALPGAIGRMGQALGASQERAIPQARLDAMGVPQNASMEREITGLPGGREEIAAAGRRMQIGQGVNQEGPAGNRLPRAANAIEDARAAIARAGQQLNAVSTQIDAAGGATVQVQPVMDRMEQLAVEAERNGAPEIARSIRTNVIPRFQQYAADGAPLERAQGMRTMLRELQSAWSGSGNPELTTTSGRLEIARRALTEQMDQAIANVNPQLRDAWRAADRDYAIGNWFLENAGRNPSGGGGLSGAVARGVSAATSAIPGAGIARGELEGAAQQAVSRARPGLRVWRLETMAPALQQMGGQAAQWGAQLQQSMQRGGAAAAATNYILSQRFPAYRDLMRQFQEGGPSEVPNTEESP